MANLVITGIIGLIALFPVRSHVDVIYKLWRLHGLHAGDASLVFHYVGQCRAGQRLDLVSSVLVPG